MKRTAYLIFILSINSMKVFGHENHKHGFKIEKVPLRNESALRTINQSYLSKIKPIFQQKCMSCHSSQTQYPWYYGFPIATQLIDSDTKEAKKHIDMSDDFPFKGHGSPEDDIEAIRGSIEKGTMPPLRYRIMHWDSKISATEKATILEWLKESAYLLKKASGNVTK